MRATNRQELAEWPRWALVASAGVVVVLAGLMVAVAARPMAVAPLSILVTVPWLLNLKGPMLPPWLYMAFPLIPAMLLNTVLYDSAGQGAAAASVFVAVYHAGESVATLERRPAIVAALLGIGVVAAHAVQGRALEDAYLIGFTAISITAGYVLRRQQETLLELRATQARLVGEATLQERQRVAREVHDVVAHSLTVTMMHLTAARMAVLRDPTTAVEALEEAERLGRQSLNEIRGTVALLRGHDERPVDRPVPTVADLDALIQAYRGAGVSLDVRTSADLERLDPNAGLTVYRVVQEAVANAIKHAPGAPIALKVHADDSAVVVRVTNRLPEPARAPSRGGLGLVGMQERTELAGGRFVAGPDGDEWVVSAIVPTATRGGGWCR